VLRQRRAQLEALLETSDFAGNGFNSNNWVWELRKRVRLRQVCFEFNNRQMTTS
jgi:hypothetical protein